MIQRKKLFATFVRFGMVGVLATALHYGLYYLLHFIMGANAAFTVGYLLGFVANFYLTSYFTFGSSKQSCIWVLGASALLKRVSTSIPSS